MDLFLEASIDTPRQTGDVNVTSPPIARITSWCLGVTSPTPYGSRVTITSTLNVLYIRQCQAYSNFSDC